VSSLSEIVELVMVLANTALCVRSAMGNVHAYNKGAENVDGERLDSPFNHHVQVMLVVPGAVGNNWRAQVQAIRPCTINV